MLHTECSLDDVSFYFLSGMFFQVDSHYIVSHLDPQMSESSTLKHSKEVQILNNFQDFLMELEGTFVVTPKCLKRQMPIFRYFKYVMYVYCPRWKS